VTGATTAASCGTYNNTASTGAGNGHGGSASASESVDCPSLVVVKVADATSVSDGSNIGFTVTVTNNGSGSAKSTVLNDPLPSGSGVDWSISPTYSGPGTCSISGAPGSQTLVCNFGDLAGSQQVSVHVTSATAFASCGTYPNTASVSAVNNGPTTAQASTSVACPALTVVKSADPVSGSTVARGSTITYTLTLSNAGSGSASGVTVTDAVPAGTSYVAGSASCGSISGCVASESNGTLTWSGISVGPGSGTAAVTFQVTVDPGDANAQVITNVAQFSNEGTPGCSTPTCSTNETTHNVQTIAVSINVAKNTPKPKPKPKPTPKPRPVVGVTTVHTGEPFAGSRPFEFGALGVAMMLLAIAEVVRRRRPTGQGGYPSA